MVDSGPCRDLLWKLVWDKTFRLTKLQKGSYTSTHPWVNTTVTKAFATLTSSAATATSADGDEYRRFGTFIANKLRNYLPPTSNKVQHKMLIFDAELRPFDVSYHVSTPSPPSQFPLPHSFLCWWFRRRNSEWSDVPLNCVNQSSVTKSNLLGVHFVSVFQTIYFMCKSFCSLQYNIFPVYFPSVHQNYQFLNNMTDRLSRNLKKILQIVHQSPVTQNRNVTAILSWSLKAAHSLVFSKFSDRII